MCLGVKKVMMSGRVLLKVMVGISQPLIVHVLDRDVGMI